MFENIEFYDTNFWFGENNISRKYTVFGEDLIHKLLKRKNENNIKNTIIFNFLSYFYDAETGNNDTLRLIEKDEFKDVGAKGALFMEQRFFFCPNDFEKWLIDRVKNGFVVLRLLPKTQKYPYEPSLFKPFYEILNEHNFPIIISIDELDITGNKSIEWDKIKEIADKFENIPIIVDGGQSKELMYNCFLLSFLNSTKNIYIETHNLLGFNQVEDLARFKSASRLIFGSYYPFFDDEMAVSRIINGGLNNHEKTKIASINIKNIIDKIKI